MWSNISLSSGIFVSLVPVPRSIVPGPTVKPHWIRLVQRVIPRERIRLPGLGQVRIDAQELVRSRVVVAVD
jgi:hypothetical protein